MRVDKALNNNSSKEMLTVCNGRTYAYPQKNPVSGGSLIYSQLCLAKKVHVLGMLQKKAPFHKCPVLQYTPNKNNQFLFLERKSA